MVLIPPCGVLVVYISVIGIFFARVLGIKYVFESVTIKTPFKIKRSDFTIHILSALLKG